MLDTSCKLGEMQKGFKGHVASFLNPTNVADHKMTDHLRELGFAEGLGVELLHHSPFGRDPIAVLVDGMTIALRREQANFILVKSE